MKTKSFDRWQKVYNQSHDWYDLIHDRYTPDVKFYQIEAKKAKGRVLEVACGTGRIYLRLLKQGVDAYGVDISAGMLKVLKRKAKESGLKPKVYRADMRKFKHKHRFSLIIIPYRSFLHNMEVDDQLKALKNLRRHLLPGGRLILNFFFPNPEVMLNTYGKVIKTPFDTEKGKFVFASKSYFVDQPNQIIEFTQELIKGGKRIWKSRFRISLIYKREFELLLRLAGFKKWKVYGGFDCRPLKSFKQEMVWIIEK